MRDGEDKGRKRERGNAARSKEQRARRQESSAARAKMNRISSGRELHYD